MKYYTTYMGRRIDELSRDELIEALEAATHEINRLMKQNEHDREFIFNTFIAPAFRRNYDWVNSENE